MCAADLLHSFTCVNMYISCTVTIVQRFPDDDFACLGSLFRFLMTDCNELNWASWPQRL